MLKIDTGAFAPTAELWLGKAFKAEEGEKFALLVAEGRPLTGRRVVIVDHPPTEGLMPLVLGLEAQGATVVLRDHHGDNPKDAATVAALRAHLGERAVISTRAAHPACAGLIKAGEFRGDIVVADADQDGVTAALKAVGVTYPGSESEAGHSVPGLDEDAAVLDGPMAGKTEAALSPLGFLLVRAWGAIPTFGTPGRDRVVAEVVSAFAEAAGEYAEAMASAERHALFGHRAAEKAFQVMLGTDAGHRLELLASEYEAKVGVATTLAEKKVVVVAGLHLLDTRGAGAFDQPTLVALLEQGALVTVTVKGDGPIAKACGGTQVSLARTKSGEAAGIDLATLAAEAFGPRPEKGWGPSDGVISNTPFLLHLSEDRWEIFRPILLAALAA